MSVCQGESTGNWEGGAAGSPQANLCHMEGSALAMKMVSVDNVGEGFSTGTMIAATLAISLKSYNSVSPYMAQILSELPSLC